MKNNLCFAGNANVVRANNAIAHVFEDYSLYGWISGFDLDTDDVLIFLPIDFLDCLSEEVRENHLTLLRKAWNDADFEILEETELSFLAYLHVGFCSRFFRLKSRT